MRCAVLVSLTYLALGVSGGATAVADDGNEPTVTSAETTSDGNVEDASATVDMEEISTSPEAKARTLGDALDSYSVRVGVESAGPILFRDTPDQRLEATSVFQFGGRLGLLFGNELLDVHRFGVGVGYSAACVMGPSPLRFLDAYLIYETGHPLILQTALGACFARGTAEFADEYGGVYGALALRYSFLRAGRTSKLSVSPGLVAKSYVATGDFQKSSFFVGAQLELAYGVAR